MQRISEQRDKIILPAPALTEFMLLAADRWIDYLTIIRRRSVFEIAGYDEPEAVELVEYWLKHGDGKKLKASAPETWAKLKYDRQIAAIAVTRRVERIYSTDSDLHKFAKQLNIKSYDIKDLPLPPTTQPSFPEFEESSADKPREEAPIPPPADVRRSGDGHPEDQADAEGSEEKASGKETGKD